MSPRPRSPSRKPSPSPSRNPLLTKNPPPGTSPTARTLPPRPVAIAITGGIGAGKTEALRAFARHGAAVASSDEVVHRLLRDDDEVRRAIVARFGTEVLDDSGGVDRAALGRVVFGDREQLDWLEALLHPRVVREYVAWREELGGRPFPPRAAAVEVPLLYETGGEERFDKVVVVTAPPEVRALRTDVSDAREERLIPDDEKIRRADFVYVNDGPLADLDRFVAGVLEQIA
ncbi:MAG: dephospho-CoA kinase [Actinobacteria bacterium]|nr:MAG: dephospho-CoA kinase [Actinomycetota bacterium]